MSLCFDYSVSCNDSLVIVASYLFDYSAVVTTYVFQLLGSSDKLCISNTR